VRSLHSLLIAGASALALLCGAGAATPAAAADIDTMIRELGLVESPAPIAQRPNWRRPRRVLVPPLSLAQLEQLRAIAPGVELVVTNDREDAIAKLPGSDALIGDGHFVCDPGVLAASRELRWVHILSAGIEQCAAATFVERNILLTNMQRTAGPFIAEHAIALLLGLTHGLNVWVARQRSGEWNESHEGTALTGLNGKTLLVAGLGGTGTEIARRASALGMRVTATRAGDAPAPSFVDHVGPPGELATLAASADVVACALPLTAQTRGLFDAKFFAGMKRGAYFLNVGRGGSVVTDDLVAALESGQLGGAGLDVTDPEPLPPGHPLWHTRNVIFSPHLAGAVAETIDSSRYPLVRENLRRYVAGERMLNVADPVRGY
jgi:phosphoglycerate dehydrogenase-like enzyme